MWIYDYEREMARSFDTPDEFIQATGYFALGASLANRVWLRSPRHLGTNLYVILTSPPGWQHKTSAIVAAVDILKKVLPKEEVLPTSPSVEALGRRIPAICKSEVGHGVLLYDEFRSFLSHIRREYAQQLGTLVMERFEWGLPTTFLRVKDQGAEEYTISGRFVLSFIASTQTSWLLDHIGGPDISSGFMSRFLIVESREQTRVYPLPPPLNESVIESLAKDLLAIREAYNGVEFSFCREAARAYSKLYEDLKRDAETHSDPEYASLISRSPVYLKKLSLIHAAMAMRGTREILVDDVEAAHEMVARSVRSCQTLLEESTLRSIPYGRLLLKVRRIISGAECISRQDLLRLVHARPRDLDEILDSLEQQGVVDVVKKVGANNDVAITWKG